MTYVQYNPVELARYINLRFVGEQEEANQQGERDKGQPEDINEHEFGVSEQTDFMTDAMDLQVEEEEMVTEDIPTLMPSSTNIESNSPSSSAKLFQEPALAPSPSPLAVLPSVSSPDPVAAPPQQREQPEDEDIDDVGLSEEELMADAQAIHIIENEMETQVIEIPTSMPSSNNQDSNSPSIVLLF